MQLNTTYYNNNSRSVTGTPIIFQDDVILLCDTSFAPVTINLLEIPTNQWLTTYKLYIIDNANNASVNNIIINAGMGQTINNAPSITLTNNGECALVRIVGNSQYVSTNATAIANPLEVKDEGVVLTPNASSMNFVGPGVTATNVGNDVTVTVNGNPLQVLDEGVSLTPNATSMNFTGPGVTASTVGNDVTVNVTGNPLEIKDEGGVLTPTASSIDFVGTGVLATTVGNDVTVTINTPTATTLAVTDTPTIDLTLTGGPAYNLSADIVDTGWVELDGFNWYGPNVQSLKPRVRRIGKVLHFKGSIMIPLRDPLNGNQPLLWDYSSGLVIDTYFNNTTITPSTTGTGSVVLNSGGGLFFNQNLNVIPSTVLPLATNLDDSYQMPYQIATRPIKIYDTPPDVYSGLLTTIVRPVITSTKRLALVLIKDNEVSVGSTDPLLNPKSTSMPNSLISHVVNREYVPEFANANSDFSSNPVAGAQAVTLDYNVNYTYPFSCNANDETNIGGFGFFKLDGLTAFIS